MSWPTLEMGRHLRAAEFAAVLIDHVLLGDFLEGQETVALGAVVDEHRLERGLDAGDDCLVDVALALFFAGGLNVEVDEFLTVNYGDPEFFRLGRIEKHAFHFLLSRALPRKMGPGLPEPRKTSD
jgi:hypothetical protein